MRLLASADGVLARREVCQAFEDAPDAPAAGPSTVATFNEKLKGGSLVLGQHNCSSRYGRVLQELPPQSGSRQEPSGGLGRLLQLTDWDFRPSLEHPVGWRWGMED